MLATRSTTSSRKDTKNPTHATVARSQGSGHDTGARSATMISTNTACSTNPPAPATTSSQTQTFSSSSGHPVIARDIATGVGTGERFRIPLQRERMGLAPVRRLEGSVSGIRGWSYVSKCDKYHFHVNCATEMAHEGWRNESYNNNNNNNDSDSLALALENLELPIQGRLRRGGGGSGSKFIRIVKMFFNAFVGILLGDPTITLTCLVAELIAS
ncbi:hypothetical protein JRO89_XS14G0065600 [Xanthoceras sorbifolium]|uniref:Uncharacterized protein n=1 Tax=Xanthoceras sorbifolium TaxID=99658 RepID=A0ABQ8H451_9ROSI|nr:hypothetical protein JRO89_XS14G0065600 [Xanthoceras sorbifolium]